MIDISELTQPVCKPSSQEQASVQVIPRATYRFQFNQHFKFTDAMQLIPYLKALGVSHCYSSPILTARNGSAHGYDIICHEQINPEIGTPEEFNQFCQTLKDHQMGLIIDIVPNHMGIGPDNAWWMDVLENGQAAEHAEFFDINWRPVKDELYGKVLLPILGDQYGHILSQEVLQVRFDPQEGRFILNYYEHCLPINPSSYSILLDQRMADLEKILGSDHPDLLEYRSLIRAFEHLPPHTTQEPEKLQERRQDRLVNLRRLSALVERSCEVHQFIDKNLEAFNRVNQNPEAMARFHELLEAQAYRLSFWRAASDEINYRRFFDIQDLAGLQIERPEVFETTHKRVLEWLEKGQITGLRVDHPDGLYDPQGYFQRLQENAKRLLPTELTEQSDTPLPLYLLAEKILAPYERLPATWQVHGTTGYDFGSFLTQLLVYPGHEETLTQIYQDFTGLNEPFHEVMYRSKKLILKTSLSSELNMLANRLNDLTESDWRWRDYTLNSLRTALAEIIANFPVYRTYIQPPQSQGELLTKKDQEYIEWAVRSAKKRSLAMDLSIFDFVKDVLLLRPFQDAENHTPDSLAGYHQFVMKFQQVTGPIMAKGLEDTAFYRYNRLACLNEVGGEPQHFGHSVLAFHRQNSERMKSFPQTMLSTSTHDSKRSEDVRARIAVLSELPELWDKYLQRWSRLNRSKKREVDAELAPDANDEYLLYQTLLGIWPFEMGTAISEEFIERITQYMIKAVREAKVHTSWLNPNGAYEEALIQFIKALLDTERANGFLDDFLGFQKQIAHWGVFNTLSQTLLKLTVPGVPDIYQGGETCELTLVDPDNRRPVDFEARKQLLATFQAQALDSDLLAASLINPVKTGIKLGLTYRCLAFRTHYSDLFMHGDYVPVKVTGPGEENLVAFIRQYEDKRCLVLAPRHTAQLCQAVASSEEALPLPVGSVWKGTQLLLEGPLVLHNVLTHDDFYSEGEAIDVSVLLTVLPIGLYELKTN